MTQKVTIIEMNLTDEIQQIISNDIAELTKENKEIIEQAAEEAKKKYPELQNLYTLLLERSKIGATMTAEQLLANAPDGYKSISPLIIKFKSFLKSIGNEYVLVKKKKEYYLVEYNVTDD